MSRYRNIHCLIWNDDKFPFSSDDCQLVWFHLFTSPFTTGIGIYKCSIEGLAAEKRWDIERYRKAFQEGLTKGFWKVDERFHVIMFPDFFKYNKPENPNVLKSWIKQYDEIPNCRLKYESIQILKVFAKRWGKPFESLCETLGVTLPKQEQEQEQEQDIKEQPQNYEKIELEKPTKQEKEAALPPADAGLFKPLSGAHFTNKVGEYLQLILDHCQGISSLNNKQPPFNVYKFIQFHLKNKTHPGAIMETLAAIKTQWSVIKEPWSYGMTVIKTKNGNWYEREEIKKYQDVDQAWDNILKTNPAVKKLLENALR